MSYGEQTTKKPKAKAATKKESKMAKWRTRVNYQQTVMEIQNHLVKAGAKKIVFDYDEAQLPSNLTFSYPFAGKTIIFSLPLRFNGVSKRMQQQGIPGGDQHAINIAWRILKDWIISQLEMVEQELAEMAEVFLPYGVTKDGQTLYEFMKSLTPVDSPLLLNQ